MTQASRWRKAKIKLCSVYTKELLDKAELHCAYDKHEWSATTIRIGNTQVYICSCGMVSIDRRRWGNPWPDLEPLWGCSQDPAQFNGEGMDRKKLYWAYRTAIRMAPYAGEFGNVFAGVIESARKNGHTSLFIQ